MEYFRWDQHWLTGIESVDAQHHGLVELVNELIELLAHAGTIHEKEVEAVFARLLDYTNGHFSDEESLMQAAGVDPRHYTAQRQQHQAFIDEMVRAKKETLGDPASARFLPGFLGNWLIFHILGYDQSMARQIAAIKTGVQAAEVFEQEQLSRLAAAEPLQHALNAMVEQLMQRNEQLVRVNESLENRVIERTQDLAGANSQLCELVGRLETEMAESQRLGRELEKANEHLLKQALTDELTGLSNRRDAMERLAQMCSESRRHSTPFSCVMIDADGFKQVNDTYGHDAGDELLRELARALQANTRKEDMVCRLGGDEFLILCPQTDKAGALKLAENLRSSIHAMKIPVGHGEWHGSLSLGVAQYIPSIERPEELLAEADQGLYAAKRGGRNRVGEARPG